MEKKFDSVFELIAEAERVNRPIEVLSLSDFDYSEVRDLLSYQLGILVKLFTAGRLRLKPKVKKTVEGWVFLEPDFNRPPEYAPYVTPSHRIYNDKNDAENHIVGQRILAKITFEVEE